MFYDNVKKLCDKKGITISKMLKEIGVSTCSVTYWKKGAEPRPSTYAKVADYFGISPEELRNGGKDLSTQIKIVYPPGYEKLTESEREFVDKIIYKFTCDK